MACATIQHKPERRRVIDSHLDEDVVITRDVYRKSLGGLGDRLLRSSEADEAQHQRQPPPYFTARFLTLRAPSSATHSSSLPTHRRAAARKSNSDHPVRRESRCRRQRSRSMEFPETSLAFLVFQQRENTSPDHHNAPAGRLTKP